MLIHLMDQDRLGLWEKGIFYVQQQISLASSFFFVYTITNKLFSNEAGTQSKPKVLNHAAIHFNRFLKNSK